MYPPLPPVLDRPNHMYPEPMPYAPPPIDPLRYMISNKTILEKVEEQLRSINQTNVFVVRMKGMPYDAKKQDVRKFFNPIIIPDNQIFIVLDLDGRPSGRGFAIFNNEGDFNHAIKMHYGKLLNRQVEIYKSTFAELESTLKEPAQHPGPNDKIILRMRGLPFQALLTEISEFFLLAGVR